MSAENRRQPRFCKRLKVLLGELELHTTNISAGGLQLSCPAMRMLALEKLQVNDPVQLSLELPAVPEVKMPCRLIYSNKAGNEWLIGFRFEQTGDPQVAPLAEYLARLR